MVLNGLECPAFLLAQGSLMTLGRRPEMLIRPETILPGRRSHEKGLMYSDGALQNRPRRPLNFAEP